MKRRRETAAPPGELTPNEKLCLVALQQAGLGVSLTTAQVANANANRGMHTSSALVALERLVERGYVGRTDRLARAANEPVRWYLLSSPAAA